MKNILFIYSDASHRKDFSRYYDYIKKELSSIYSQIDLYKSPSLESTFKKAAEACVNYSSLVIVSGDGTFQQVLSKLALKEKLPTIGFINKGTLGDVGKNFGIRRNLKKSVKIIKKQHTCRADFIFDGENGFCFVGAIGHYADIPYKVNKKSKKFFRRFAYYFSAVKDLFKKELIHYKVTYENTVLEGEAPFVMLMNGKYVGGFKVNKKSKIDDNIAELYISKKGLLNGLVKYIFNRNKPIRITGEVSIETKENMLWDYDGEPIIEGKKTFKLLKNKFEIYCK